MARRSRKKGTELSLQQLVSWLISFGGRLFFAAVVIVVVLTFAQCTVNKPEAPQWNTQFTLPLVNRTYQMPELIRKMDQSGIGFDTDSNVVFAITQELDTTLLDPDNLATGDLSYTLSQTIGKVAIVNPVVSPITMNISAIGGLPGVYPAALPASSFSVVADFPTISNYTSAVVDTGLVYVIISNNLGIDIDTISIQLFDQGNLTSLGSSSLPGGLPNGAIDSVPFSLDGRTISNSLNSTVSCHTPGGTVNDASGKDISVVARFSGNLIVSSATAQIPAIQRSFAQSVSLLESDIITDATLAGGTMTLSITNNTAVVADLLITIQDLRLAGVSLTIARQIAGFGSAVVNQSLAGYSLQPSDLTAPQELPIEIQADIQASAPNQVTISEGQSFSVSATLSGLQFGSVSGYFSSTVATLDTIRQNIDIPRGFDSVRFTSVVLTLEIDNAVALPGRLDLSMAGDNGKTLAVAGNIDARVLATAATTELVQPDVASFFTPIPSQVTITGTAGFGDGQLGTIRAGDYVTGRVRIESPLEMVIPETPIETDVENETIDQKDIDKITDHVLAARFVYNVTNHLPLGATLNLLIGPDSANLFTTPQLRIDNITIGAAPVTSGIVSDTLSTGYQTISIDSADVQILKNPKLYIAQQLILHGTGGQAVRLTKNDFISVNGRIEVEYRFDGQF